MHKGSCNCGAVSFVVSAALRPPDACHCSLCRRQSGHYWASTNVKPDEIAIDGADHVTWFQASDKVRRGFCKTCGCFLFWDPLEHEVLAVGMGAFDKPTQTTLEVHIHVADRGDYYDIADNVAQRDGH